MTHPRLLLAAGSVAASLVAVAPVGLHSTSAASAPLRVASTGIAVSVSQIAAQGDHTMLVVPEGMTHLAGTDSGSPALASRTRMTIVRSSDHATVFTGSLATFTTLPVAAGTKLIVSVQKPAGMAGLTAGALLRWS
jgi:hypothetical protein